MNKNTLKATLFLTIIILISAIVYLPGRQSTKPQPSRAEQPSAAKGMLKITADDFVKIPAGCFEMGASKAEDGGDEEYPQHQACISQAFYLQKTELTQAQWKTVMGSSPSHFSGANLPVENVSWNDVQAFIAKLNKQTGKQYRLPTEAEWEYAARAGSTTRYSFGDDESRLQNYAWYEDNSNNQTRLVKQKQPNPWGLYDMHGNVWEWVSDRYAKDYYKDSPEQDPQGPSSGSERVNRGGGWDYDRLVLRSAARSRNSADHKDSEIGFRLALSVQYSELN